jgi:hypothetical protein
MLPDCLLSADDAGGHRPCRGVQLLQPVYGEALLPTSTGVARSVRSTDYRNPMRLDRLPRPSVGEPGCLHRQRISGVAPSALGFGADHADACVALIRRSPALARACPLLATSTPPIRLSVLKRFSAQARSPRRCRAATAQLPSSACPRERSRVCCLTRDSDSSAMMPARSAFLQRRVGRDLRQRCASARRVEFEPEDTGTGPRAGNVRLLLD